MIRGLSNFAMDKEMLDQILAMATEMASELEACKAVFRAARSAFVADCDGSGREVDATSGTGYNSDDLASNLVTAPSASPAPSPTSAPDQNADPGFQFGVTKLPAASPTRCSTPSPNQGVHVPGSGNSDRRDREVPNSSRNDLWGVDRLSRLQSERVLDDSDVGKIHIAITEFLSAMHTRCSVQGHGSGEVTTLSPSAFSMSAVAVKGTLHHEENTSELLRIPLLFAPEKLLLFGILRMAVIGLFKDWQEQPWSPRILVEILDSQVEGNIIELRPNPSPSFEHSVSLIHGVTYMLLSCDTNLQQLGNLPGFSIIWHVSILNLIADPSKCRVQWKPPWVSYVGRNFAGCCSFIMVFSGQNVVAVLLMLVQARCMIVS